MDLRQSVIPVTALALIASCGAVLLYDGFSEAAIRATIRITANTSYLLLLLAFSASSLRRLLGPAWQPVLQARRRIGLAFTFSHTLHALTILLLVYLVFDGDYARLGNLLPGGFIYLVIYLMALTSNDTSVRRLGARRWQILHRTGIYILVLAFTGNHIGDAMEAGGYYWGFSALGILALLLRFLPGRTVHA